MSAARWSLRIACTARSGRGSRARWSRLTSNAVDSRTDWPASGAELVEAVLSHYRAALSETPAAITWLLEHGVVNGDVVDAFALGFADRSLGLSLPAGVAGHQLRDRLKQLGLLRATGHELFRG